MVQLTGDFRYGIDAYYDAPDSEALRRGEEAGDAFMGFAMQTLLDLGDGGTWVANIFGGNLTMDDFRLYLDTQSAAFQFGRRTSDVFITLAGASEIISGLATIIASLSVAAGGVAGGALAVIPTGGASVAAGGLAITVSAAGVATGVGKVTAGAFLMAKGFHNLSKPLELHHFATNKNRKYTERLRAIAKKYGLDLNEPWNKEHLPHRGRHPNEYHDWVLSEMQACAEEAGTSASTFLGLFEKRVKGVVRKHPEMLTKAYWQ